MIVAKAVLKITSRQSPVTSHLLIYVPVNQNFTLSRRTA